jgi:hypothetical protein
MQIQSRLSLLAVLILGVCVLGTTAPGITAQEAPIVGRIAHIDGQILRYVQGAQENWVPAVKDSPLGMNDAVHSDVDARAEFIIPNGLWLRMGANTQIQIIALKSDTSQIDVAFGIARFYNKSSNGLIKATTPFGFVLAGPGTIFDLYVGDRSLEVVSLDGTIDFINAAGDSRSTITPGAQSILADKTQTASSDGTVDSQWDDWNGSRDALWRERVRVASAKHLPAELNNSAHVLEESGRWERLYYDGSYREFWRPTSVAASWQPFTVGRWTEWNGDQCWVPDESFGYVTHHYGNWMMVNANWYWDPPVQAVEANTGISGCAWYPGRVSWVYSESEVGWVQLAPDEVYVTHNYWGPQAVLIDETAPPRVVNAGNLVYYRSAIIIPRTALYSVTNYYPVRVAGIHADTLAGFHSAASVRNIPMKDPDQIDRYRFSNAAVTFKPNQDAVKRVEQNRQIGVRNAKELNAANFKQALLSTKTVEPSKNVAVQPPRFLVGSQPSNIKKNVKPATASSATTQGHPSQGGGGSHAGALGSAPQETQKSELQSISSGVQRGQQATPPAQTAPSVKEPGPSANHPVATGTQTHQTGPSATPSPGVRPESHPANAAEQILQSTRKPENPSGGQHGQQTVPTAQTAPSVKEPGPPGGQVNHTMATGTQTHQPASPVGSRMNSSTNAPGAKSPATDEQPHRGREVAKSMTAPSGNARPATSGHRETRPANSSQGMKQGGQPRSAQQGRGPIQQGPKIQQRLPQQQPQQVQQKKK